MSTAGSVAEIYITGNAAEFAAACDEASASAASASAAIDEAFGTAGDSATASATEISSSFEAASTESSASVEGAAAKMDASFEETAAAAAEAGAAMTASSEEAAAAMTESTAAAGSGMVEDLGAAGAAAGGAMRDEVSASADGMTSDLENAGVLAGTKVQEGVSEGTEGMKDDLGKAGTDGGNALSSGLTTGAKKAQTTLTKVGKWALLGGAAIAAGATKMAIDWQESMTQLVTGAGQAKSSVGTVSSGLLNMAGQVGESTKDLASGMYLVESAGYHGAQGLDVLKAAAEGAKVGAATMASVATTVTSALNAYGLKAKTATAVTNELVSTVASGKMHMQTLASSIASVLPVAASAHISLAQVGGAIATMTAQGMSARRASMGLANMIRAVIAPSATASNEMRNLGITANHMAEDIGKNGLTGTLDQFTAAILKNTAGGSVMATGFDAMSPKAKGLAEAILSGKVTTTQLTTAMKTLTPVQAKMVTNFEAQATSATGVKKTWDSAMKTMVGGATGLNVALLLTGPHAQTFASNVRAVGASAAAAGKTVKGFATVQHDMAFQLDSAKDSAEALGIQFGNVLLPKLEDAAHVAEDVVGWFGKNKVAAEALAAVVGGVLSVAVGVYAVNKITSFAHSLQKAWTDVTKFGSKVATMASSVVSHFQTTASGTSEAADEMQASTTEMTTSMEEIPVAAETAATTTDVAMDTMAVTTDEAAAATDAAIGSTGIGAILIGLGLAVTLLATHWKAVWGAIKTAAIDVWHALESAVHEVESALSTAWHAVESTAESIWNDIVSFFKTIWSDIKTVFEDTSIVGLLMSHWTEVESDAKAVWGDIVSFFEGIPSKIMDALSALGSDLENIAETAWRDFLTGIKTIWTDVSSFVGSIPGKIEAFFKDAGTWLLDAGKDILTGLEHGLEDGVGAVLGKVKSIGSDIVSGFKSILSIFSPSQVMAQTVGVPIVQGIATGMTTAAPTLSAAAVASIKVLSNAFMSEKTKLTATLAAAVTQAIAALTADMPSLGTAGTDLATRLAMDLKSGIATAIQGGVAQVNAATAALSTATATTAPSTTTALASSVQAAVTAALSTLTADKLALGSKGTALSNLLTNALGSGNQTLVMTAVNSIDAATKGLGNTSPLTNAQRRTISATQQGGGFGGGDIHIGSVSLTINGGNQDLTNPQTAQKVAAQLFTAIRSEGLIRKRSLGGAVRATSGLGLS